MRTLFRHERQGGVERRIVLTQTCHASNTDVAIIGKQRFKTRQVNDKEMSISDA